MGAHKHTRRHVQCVYTDMNTQAGWNGSRLTLHTCPHPFIRVEYKFNLSVFWDFLICTRLKSLERTTHSSTSHSQARRGQATASTKEGQLISIGMLRNVPGTSTNELLSAVQCARGGWVLRNVHRVLLDKGLRLQATNACQFKAAPKESKFIKYNTF